MILQNTKENSKPNNQISLVNKKPKLEWLPLDCIKLYNQSDLLYSDCLKIFCELEATTRDSIPETTMRQWFIEFLKAGWTLEIIRNKYNALIRNKRYGSIDFASWVNAQPVYGYDEVNIIVKNKIDKMIRKGYYLLHNFDKLTELTEHDKRCLELAAVKELEFEMINEKLNKSDDYKLKLKQIKRGSNGI